MTRSKIVIAGLTWLLSSCIVDSVARPATADQPGTGAIVVQNFYYALPGKAAEVYALRLHASDVRAALGLPRGRVLRRTTDEPKPDPSSPIPDVIWECEYPTLAAREIDVATLGRSKEFERVEERMDHLLRKFARATFEPSGRDGQESDAEKRTK